MGGTARMVAGFVEFEFDLPDALLNSLIGVLDNMQNAPLLPGEVGAIPDAQGVYQLSLNDQVVYIGKTDAEAGLKRRLERHSHTIQHRKNLNPAHVRFKAVRVFVFTAIDLETQLIRHYGAKGPVPWNKSGFGSNDPGRNRDATEMKPEGFDSLYQIDIDRNVDLDFSQVKTVADAFRLLREILPYTFRFETLGRGGRQPHPELHGAKIQLQQKQYTTRTLIETVMAHLPKGWQATELAGRVILYREMHEYPYGSVIARS